MAAAARKPLVLSQDGRVLIDVSPQDADELLVHLRSHNIHAAVASDPPGLTTWLEVQGHPAEDVEAVLGEWEVVPR